MKLVIPPLVIAASLAAGLIGCSSKIEVPPVTGLDLSNATVRLSEKGFTVAAAPSEMGGPATTPGAVLRQEPASGQRAPKGSAVQLTVDDSLLLPSFGGLDINAAGALAASQQLQAPLIEKRSTGKYIINSVIDQMPAPNTRVRTNSPLTLTLESGGIVGRTKELIENTQDKIKDGKKVIDGLTDAVDVVRGLLGKDKKKDKDKDKGNANSDGNSDKGSGSGVSQNGSGSDPRRTASDVSGVLMLPRSPAIVLDKQPIRVSFRYATGERHGVVIRAIPMRHGQPLPRYAGANTRSFSAALGEGILEVTAPAGSVADEFRLEMRSAKDPARLLWESRLPVDYRFGMPARVTKVEETLKHHGLSSAEPPPHKRIP